MAYLSILREFVKIQARICFWSLPPHRLYSTSEFHHFCIVVYTQNVMIDSCQNHLPLSSITSQRRRTAIYLRIANANSSTQFGCIFWTMSSLRLTEMELLSDVMMGYFAVSTLESLHILQIIRKSKHTCIFTLYELNFLNRILLATIRDNGSSPCPRCYVPRASFGRLGFVSDILSRLSHAHNYLHSKIRSARHLIYQCGKAIKSVAVERILKEYSLVPTLVSLAR